MEIDEINNLSAAAFVECFGGIYEHSAWVAEAAEKKRPFASSSGLIAAMRQAVDMADSSAQIALIRAHPDLAGKLALAGELSAASASEQSGLGLDRLAVGEFELFHDLNSRYKDRFGFPFVICVRLTDKAGILAAFESRLLSDVETEIQTAIKQIHHIAQLRLKDMLAV